MLLSDELIKIGRTANPKNNQSMAEKANIIHEKLKKAHDNGTHSLKQLFKIVQLVCDTLNNEGYKYYKTNIFFLN